MSSRIDRCRCVYRPLHALTPTVARSYTDRYTLLHRPMHDDFNIAFKTYT